MKKIIALILSLACVFALVSCEGDTPETPDTGAETIGISDIVNMYAASLPTKILTTTKQEISDNNIVLNGTECLVMGKLDGKVTTVYTYERDELNAISDSDIIEPLIKTVSGSKVYHDKKVSIDGGSWKSGVNFAPTMGDIAINLDETLLIDVVYDDATSTLSFRVAADNTALIFGEDGALESDVDVTITNDGAVITGITLDYVIAATKDYPETKVSIKTVYTYDLEEITLP